LIASFGRRHLTSFGRRHLTDVKTHSGWVHVGFIIDVYSQMIVGCWGNGPVVQPGACRFLRLVRNHDQQHFRLVAAEALAREVHNS
jgi:hypothetical protein